MVVRAFPRSNRLFPPPMIWVGILVLLVSRSAQALPRNLPPNVSVRIVFVTSTTTDGNIGGLAGADSLVGAAAGNPGSLVAGQTVKAILSVVGTLAQSRFVDNGEPIYNARGQIVAARLSQMFAGGTTILKNPILYDEAGTANAGTVWTGTDANGALAPTHCTSYSTNTTLQDGRIGSSDLSDSKWTELGTLNCVNPARLYGLTDVITVPGTPAPTLGSLALGTLVLLLVGVAVKLLQRRHQLRRVA